MIMEKMGKNSLRKSFNEMTVRIICLINCYQNVRSDTVKLQDNYGRRPSFNNFIKFTASQIGITSKDFKKVNFSVCHWKVLQISQLHWNIIKAPKACIEWFCFSLYNMSFGLSQHRLLCQNIKIIEVWSWLTVLTASFGKHVTLRVWRLTVLT